MIKSMTGYGRGEASNAYYKFKIEIKSVNHRYSNIHIKLPYYINHLEEHIRKRIETEIKRGSIDVYINLEYIDASAIDVKPDLDLAYSYKESMELIIEKLSLEDKVKLEDIISMSDIFIKEKKELDNELLLEPLNESMDDALLELIDMRSKEGKELEVDMREKLININSYLREIEEKASLVVREYRDRLEQNISKILEDKSLVDQDKLSNEVAFFADKASIDEEVVRLKSHIEQFYQILDRGGIVGRKLDFLIQEINREINTIGSKSTNTTISKNVVNIKSELEKIREQVQNIE